MTLRHHIFSDWRGRYKGAPLPHPAHTKKVFAYTQVAELAVQGLTRQEIATRLGCTIAYVAQICWKREIITARPPASLDATLTVRDAELIRFFLEGRTLEETGQRFQISRERARQILVANDIMARGLGKKIKPPKAPEQTQEQKFWSMVNKDGPTQPHMDTPCWEWTRARSSTNVKSDGTRAQGYGKMQFRGKGQYAHIISWILSNRVLKPKQWVLHRCHNSLCVNPDHLYEGAAKDNAQDRERSGRGSRKIPLDRVPDIETMILEGRSDKEISTLFGVTPNYIRCIRVARTRVRYGGQGGVNRRKLSASDVETIRDALREGQTLKELASRFDVGPTAIWMIKQGKTYKTKTSVETTESGGGNG